MKRIITFTILFMTLTACVTFQVQVPQPVSTDIPQVKVPNPASVYCEQNGNKLEIQTSSDGSQHGICVFPDGSACDEWAYYQGECGPAAQANPTSGAAVQPTTNPVENPVSDGAIPSGTSEEVVNWWGIIKSIGFGAQYDDYFERQDLGQAINFGIDSMHQTVKSQIEDLRDSGKVVHLYGTLLNNVPDYNGSQIQVDHIVVEE